MEIETDIKKLVNDYREGKITPKWDEDLFKRCAVTLLMGQTESGKTCLFLNILFKILLAKYKWKDIFIYSKTIFKDKKNWEPVLELIDQVDPNLIHSNIKMNLNTLTAKCDEITKASLLGEIEDPILMYLDDMIGEKAIAGRTSKFSLYMPIARHDFLSFICACQKYNLISTTLRENCPQIFLGFCTAGLQSIFEDCAVTVPIKIMKAMYQAIVLSNPYQFVVIRKDKMPLTNGYFRHNIAGPYIDPYQFQPIKLYPAVKQNAKTNRKPRSPKQKVRKIVQQDGDQIVQLMQQMEELRSQVQDMLSKIQPVEVQ